MKPRDRDGPLLSRRCLAAIFLVRTTPLANLLPIPLAHVRGPLFGWPMGGVSFAWWGVALPSNVQMAFCILRTIAALLFLVGWRPRVSGSLAGTLGLVALSQDPFAFIFTLYTLFVGTIALGLSDAPISTRSPLRVVHFFVASVYIWSALAKMQMGWLSGDTLRALADDGLVTPWVADLLRGHAILPSAVAWGALATELALPALLLASARTRRIALPAALLFHLALEVATHPDVMTAVIAALLLSFVGIDRRTGASFQRAVQRTHKLSEA